MNVDGEGTLLTADDFTIGYEGTGILCVTDGAALEGSGVLGYSSGSIGTVTIDGGETLWTNGLLYIGWEGTGALSISNGAAVSGAGGSIGALSGAYGEVSVDGDDATWTATSGITVGLKGSGTLSVTNGGSVTTGQLIAGHLSESSSGFLTIDGEGSSLTSSYQVEIGNYGTVEMNIANGGTVTDVAGYIGHNSWSYGTVSVDGVGSAWTNSSRLFVGYSGGTGTLAITNGGVVTIGVQNTYIGSGGDAIGTVTVDGEGSTFAGSGELVTGRNGAGTLVVTNGGTVTNTYGYIGCWSDSVGKVTLDGEDTSWTNSSTLYVGYQGTGSLSVFNSGLVSASSLSINSISSATVDVNSSLNLGTEDNDWTGIITNAGKVRLVAGADADSGTYTPISYSTMSGNGTVQALGGVWGEDAHIITVSEAVAAQGDGGATTAFDQSQYQRTLITDSITGMSAGAAFMAADEYTSISFTATTITDDALLADLADLIADTDEEILSVWNFSTEGYTVSEDAPVYLSLYAAAASDQTPLSLTIWHLVDGVWTKYDNYGLAFDGIYASFVATSLNVYAVTAEINNPCPADLDEDGDVDGQDLSSFISEIENELTIEKFASLFGKN
nr:hypothetical protein [uncultured Desulfobacter sp.]